MKQYQSQPQKSPSNREKSNTVFTQMESAEHFYSNEHNQHDQYFNQIIQMLQKRQVFQEQEYKIKVTSLEKRIKYLIQISSQLTQQNTQLKLQYSDLAKEYEILKGRIINYESTVQNKNQDYSLSLDDLNKLKIEREKLIGLANKYHERSKIRKKQIIDQENTITILQKQVNDLHKDNIFLGSEKQNLLLQFQQNQQFVNQQQNILEEDIINKTQQIDLSNKNEIQTIITRFLNDYCAHLTYINNETNQLVHLIKEYHDINLDVNNQQKYNRLIKQFDSLITKYNQMLEQQIKFQYQFNISTQDNLLLSNNSQNQYYHNNNVNNTIQCSKKNSQNNFYQNNLKQDILRTSKFIKIQSINIFLNQIVESFIIYIFRIRNLNHQILQSDPSHNEQKTTLKKIVILIIAIIRMQKKKKYHDYKQLVVELPIEETMYQLLEIISTQQQLIEKYQE
ncbi:unnamed protein product (macronuclear) [Paramecium tetraurelia]|uniref:Uncharacterized protein n=1 Tax=Paramecium tetraurelia TaxID=5888 RepID=A0BIZ6_PARTE|nr:uncharacterized protein GSPATT00004886001 [Paramecium tetraurelia]CAK58513.1 unnamed protein product [Paramecium tetraurelia]|eukprot:XP_001425911.1 hypothetical protein (macronuclear) [Paramecium tetraurelia strain d4-2]